MVMKSRSRNDAEFDEYGGPQHGNLSIITNHDALLYAKIFIFFHSTAITSNYAVDDRWMLIQDRSNISNVLDYLML